MQQMAAAFRAASQQGRFTVVGAYYELDSGRVQLLPV